MATHVLWEHEIAGSSPASPTSPALVDPRSKAEAHDGARRPVHRARPRDPAGIAAHRRPQRPGLRSASARRGHADVDGRPARPRGRSRHRHPASSRGRRRGPILVGLGPGGPARARSPPDGARAARCRPPLRRALSRRVRVGDDGGRSGSSLPRRPHRVADRPRRRVDDRELDGGPAPVPRARRPLHDAHPLADDALGRRRDRSAAARRPDPVRSRGRARDEPARDAGRPQPRLARRRWPPRSTSPRRP